MIEWINEVLLLSNPMVQRALIAGILIALCTSLLGVPLVLKRMSFIGLGLSNVAFGSVAIATAANLTNNLFLVLPVTVGSSILLMRTSRSKKVGGDSAIAMIAVGAMAIGYLVWTIYPSPNLAVDVCETLFGSWRILRLTWSDVWVFVALAVMVITVFIMFYHRIFSVTFDEDFSIATGTKAGVYNLILAVVIAITIVLAINLVGTLLIIALVVFPAMSAMRIFKSFFSVILSAVIISIFSTALGILFSVPADTPVGPTIVAAQIVVFGIFWLAGLVARR
jgi:zinc transport system permease protein